MRVSDDIVRCLVERAAGAELHSELPGRSVVEALYHVEVIRALPNEAPKGLDPRVRAFIELCEARPYQAPFDRVEA
eukprot:3943022-Heterocapsa_arctica.AAC.1